MEIDPKTVVWYPLFTLILYLVLSLLFDLALWTLFLTLSIIVIYFIVIIIIEIKK